jgi:hypothetical protein
MSAFRAIIINVMAPSFPFAIYETYFNKGNSHLYKQQTLQFLSFFSKKIIILLYVQLPRFVK